MLISVHIPKTAGSSFANSLADHFGNKLIKDYTDLPLHSTSFSRNLHALTSNASGLFNNYNDVKCIHGHFLPLKYRLQPIVNKNTQFITWMRDPAERLASHYYYFKRNYNNKSMMNQPLIRRMIDENWSLERFCLGKELRNTYSQFFWAFPIELFSFIGIVEHYETDLRFFSQQFLSKSLKPYKENTNSFQTKKSYFNDQILKKTIQNYHNKDYILYEKACQRRITEQQLSNIAL